MLYVFYKKIFLLVSDRYNVIKSFTIKENIGGIYSMLLKKTESYDDCILLTFIHVLSKKEIRGSIWENGKEEKLIPDRHNDEFVFKLDKQREVRTLVFRIYEGNDMVYRRRILVEKGMKNSNSIWNQKISLDLTYSNKEIIEYTNKRFN